MSKRFIITFLALLIFIAGFVRVSGGNDYYYSEDEAFHTGLAEARDLKEVLQFSLYETHPPLGHVIRHYWLQLSDDIGFSRSLSLVFGLALILLYYRIGKILNGELTGICCAILVAFSYCCIIQSYVVRNYTIFLLFISLAYYYYLRWRSSRNDNALAYYFLFGILACLTHFMAIFSLFVIAVYEMAVLWLKKEKVSVKLAWAGVNLVLAVLCAATYSLWHDTLLLARPYFNAQLFAHFFELLTFPVRALFYLISPSKFVIIPLLLCSFAVLEKRPFRRLLVLFWVALATALFLSAMVIYPACGDRHDVWLLPFVIPVAGWMVSGFIGRFSTRLAKTSPLNLSRIRMVLVITFAFAELALYDPQVRFSDYSEYGETMADQRTIQNYLAGFDSKTMLVFDKDDAILEKSFYPYLGDDMFSGHVMATVMPYGNTHILFNPYYHHIRTWRALLDMMNEAEKRHMLDGIDTLVFVRALPKAYENIGFVKSLPASELMSCELLDSQHIILTDNFEVLQVSKEVFFNDVVPEAGKAHNCLHDYPDMQNFIEPPPTNRK